MPTRMVPISPTGLRMLVVRIASASLLLVAGGMQQVAEASFSPCRDPEFSRAVSYPIGATPSDLVAGDLNGDGRLDLVAPVGLAGVAVVLNTGGGTFGPAAIFPTGGRARAVAVGDFNGDDQADLAVINRTEDGTDPPSALTLVLNSGDGIFGAPLFILTQPSLFSVAAADLNGDQKLDLVVGSHHPRAPVYVLLGNGAATFQTPLLAFVGGSPTRVALGDFNNDGVPDLAVGVEQIATGDRLMVFLGLGTGRFAFRWSTPAAVLDMAIGDVNGDGNPDIVTMSSGSVIGGFDRRFTDVVHFGTGAGTFWEDDADGRGFSGSVAVGDVTGDGWAELVNTVDDDGQVIVVPSPPLSLLVQAMSRSYPVPFEPVAVLVADLDGDGRKDIAAASERSNSISVLLNTCNGPVLGGRGLTILTNGSDPGAPYFVNLTWWRGGIQAGYHVVRTVGSSATVLTSTPLARDAVTFSDPSPVPNQTNCYIVVPIDSSGSALGLSDMLCVQPNTGSGYQWSIALNQSNTVAFPTEGPQPHPYWGQLNAHPVDGSTPASPEMGMYVGRHDTGGVMTCYSFVYGSGTTVWATSDIFCAVPGVATIGSNGEALRPVPQGFLP